VAEAFTASSLVAEAQDRYNGLMKLEYRKLTDDEIRRAIDTVSGWSEDQGQITKTFEFKTYKDGVVFASAVGYVADGLNHHPDIDIRYGKVRVAVNTHDVGGLSPYDFELARRIEALG
jgi:4a-hydroxytetrahydrobiopterin dehydratase